jgi:uncharacterized membrane protein YebE (DUF533 family)
VQSGGNPPSSGFESETGRPRGEEVAAMFDAKKLLDALVGAAAQIGQAPAQGSGPAGGTGSEKPLNSQIDQTLKQVTGLDAGALVQKAKDAMAQHPALAPAVMLALAGMFTSKKKTGRAIPGGLARLGGLALIGTLAYKAYQNRQAGKPLLDIGGLVNTASDADRTGIARDFHALDLPERSGFHPTEQSEDDILLFLRAMVAAASADGHIDQRERELIVKGLAEAGIDPEATRWLDREMESPADVEELAATVSTPEKAAQVYAAARVAIDPDTVQEREFLRRLAESLDVEPAMRSQIDETADALKASA